MLRRRRRKLRTRNLESIVTSIEAKDVFVLFLKVYSNLFKRGTKIHKAEARIVERFSLDPSSIECIAFEQICSLSFKSWISILPSLHSTIHLNGPFDSMKTLEIEPVNVIRGIFSILMNSSILWDS